MHIPVTLALGKEVCQVQSKTGLYRETLLQLTGTCNLALRSVGSVRPVWVTREIPDYPELHGEALSKKLKKITVKFLILKYGEYYSFLLH